MKLHLQFISQILPKGGGGGSLRGKIKGRGNRGDGIWEMERERWEMGKERKRWEMGRCEAKNMQNGNQKG